MNKKRIISLLLIFCMVFSLLPLGVIKADATQEDEQVKEDAMDSINSDLNEFKLGQTQTIADDGYIGIPVEISIYFDSANYTVRSGYGGTPVIIYVVNTYAERVGTDTDSEIIESMLRRGYVVTVLDYKNDVRAVSPDLDWSVQGIRNDIKAKKYFNDSVFPQGTYYDNYVVPAGCNVSLYNVFWEADKHGVDGTLEKIVEIWNTDFRGVKGEKLVKWVYSDGTRKSTLDKANDGTAPVLYDANGNFIDLGFYRRVEPICANLPRQEYADQALFSRMKIMQTNADVSDLSANIEESIKRAKNNNPICIYKELMQCTLPAAKKIINDYVQHITYEDLVEKYLRAIGANEVLKPAPNESSIDEGDADRVAYFEQLKVAVMVQIKKHDYSTDDWSVNQIELYKNNHTNQNEDYNVQLWVVSNAEDFTEEAKRKAQEANVRLINGNDFAKMILDVGLKHFM